MLNEDTLRSAAHWLAERDEALDFVLKKYGYPSLWAREPSFSTLVHIILEQQVSLASANAAFAKLQAAIGPVTPVKFLVVSDEDLRIMGFSRQKMRYTRLLAEAVESGSFNIEHLGALPDEAVITQMKQLKGIGDWTAHIYLSECLLRPDILPKGDIALLEAFKVLKNLPQRPPHDEFTASTEHWRPWRSVGIRMLWHFYLSERVRPTVG